ncbi:MAG: hypothetical protein ACOY94_00760 [Bacillota bacterium]
MSWLMNIVGLQLLAWALGMTVTVVLFDSAAGFVRDHPPHAWRAAGILAGPLALVSFACLLHCSAPLWLSLGVVLPFALMASAYSWAWFHRTPAETRRRLGRQAMIMGLITVLFVSLQLGSEPQAALVLAAFAGSAALLGGLGTLCLVALMGGRHDEVEVPFSPYGMPARIIATGLGITLLALLDGGLGSLEGLLVLPVRLWIAFSLLIPLALVAAGHRLFPRWQPPIWTGAFGSVLVGQMALHAALILS